MAFWDPDFQGIPPGDWFFSSKSALERKVNFSKIKKVNFSKIFFGGEDTVEVKFIPPPPVDESLTTEKKVGAECVPPHAGYSSADVAKKGHIMSFT